MLRSTESRHALAQYGSIGALPRYAYVSPLIAKSPCAARSNLSFTVMDARFALDQFAPYVK